MPIDSEPEPAALEQLLIDKVTANPCNSAIDTQALTATFLPHCTAMLAPSTAPPPVTGADG